MQHSFKATLFFVVIIIQGFLFCAWIFIYRGSMYEQISRNDTSNVMTSLTTQRKRKCPLVSPGLVGQLKIDKVSHSWETIEEKFSKIKDGHHCPENCKARQKVAIIIPFRDRENQLRVFLNHMHPILMRQQLEYGIYVVEQSKGLEFNRGFLFNVGFKEALKDSDYECFILHDVDLLPENDYNTYTCSTDHPKHLTAGIDKWNYKMLYTSYFGGVSGMTREQYEAINGFSNSFFGWGGEDDDLYNRVIWSKMSVYRIINDAGKYTSLQHKQAVGNSKRFEVLKTGKERMWKDGLNTLKYNLLQKTYKQLYIHLTVNVT
uniref:Beta-1,4-galactosyltransferase n=1 Tax=Crassostrea virginica TaxID=6565 RepID=A0A8B8CJH6_CRAVI|nr:beta-1,4-galactosyltransferase 4-like isoform X2 [Crassostrea virginica]